MTYRNHQIITRKRKRDDDRYPTFGRYAELSVECMTPEQRAGCSVVEGSRGRLPVDPAGSLRPGSADAWPCKHHRYDRADGLLHLCVADYEFLRRASERRRHPAALRFDNLTIE